MSDKMMLRHHKDCQFEWWIKPAKPVCDCYMSWIHKDLKELDKLRQENKKIPENMAMKLTDIPPHVTEIDPPWFFREYYKKYKVHENDLEDIIPLYNIDYYDGPLSGMFKVHDNYFYGKAIYCEDRKWWACWELAEDELTKEQERHRLFQQYVGTHTDYYKDAEGSWIRDFGTCKPRESCDVYYNMENKPQVDYKEIESREIFGVLRNPFRNW